MQMPDDARDAFPRMLQTLAGLMSQHTDDREIDGENLSQCDEELDALRSVQRQLERRVALVCRKRNTFAPVNALPLELLVTIFTIVTDSEPVQVWSDRETLMLVCHHWNQLLNNTPTLWTKIQKSAEISDAIITRALEMSKDAPLEIDYGGTVGRRAAQERQQAFLSIIFPHANRWRKAVLGIHGAVQALEPMTSLSAPLLESLSLWAIDPAWAGDKPLDIFGGRPPPRLRELSLNRIPVPWSPKTLCNLKALKITSIDQLAPSLDQLFAILPASPGLESLSIVDVTFSGGASASIPNPIHMPTLGKLSLEVISPAITNRILAAIHAPDCKFGSLRPTLPLDPFETLFIPEVSHLFDHFRSGASTSSFYCGGGEVTVSWEGSWNIVLDVENIRVAKRVLEWLSVSPEPDPPAVPLRLTITEVDSLLVEDIVAVMTGTEAVRQIEFGYHAPLAGLAAGGLVEGSDRMSFPGLRDLIIRKSLDDDEWETLLRVFRSRHGDVEVMGGDQRLNPLRSLELGEDWNVEDEGLVIAEFKSIHWPNRLEEIRRLLGHDGKLRWYRWIVAEDGTLEEQPGLWRYIY
ncbi:hypothetical protein FS837_007230 [Tulasnella sp. UAMH 9824]|nr:hypothetical protein FS837_007230 [Tulasnella sp. UAMH 9824]